MDPMAKANIIMKAMDVAGQLAHTAMSRPQVYDKQRDIDQKYFDELATIARGEGARAARDELAKTNMERYGEGHLPIDEDAQDLPPEETGTACLACSKNHISTVSSALGEAVRFVRKGGIRHPEVIRRMRIALDELNIMERIDLSPERVARLQGKEREMAEWILDASRRIRHMLDDITNPEIESGGDDLMDAAAAAADVHEQYILRLFNLIEDDTNVDVTDITTKVCAKYEGSPMYEKCEATIQEFFNKKEG
jgi:hypothetical protein